LLAQPHPGEVGKFLDRVHSSWAAASRAYRAPLVILHALIVRFVLIAGKAYSGWWR
jgi:hypothetical protein